MRQLKIVSLNIQHGWNSDTGFPTVFTKATAMANLNKIVSLLKAEQPDIVLLQEVDRASPFSRGIDQMEYIAKRVGDLHYAHGASTEMKIRDYKLYSAGCGILSRYPILESKCVKFDLAFPNLRKGFLMATIAVDGGEKVTVVSAHLPFIDILNPLGRRDQIERMIETLKDKRPVIVGGDLNMSLSLLNSENIRSLASGLKLKTHGAAVNSRLATYPAWGPKRKIDWIFASPELSFSEYRVLSERVSDHLAVGTTVTY